MNEIGIVQRRLAENKDAIWHLQVNIKLVRGYKKDFDEEGNLEEEYQAHNCLKQYRKQLKQLVEEQRFLKQLKKYLGCFSIY